MDEKDKKYSSKRKGQQLPEEHKQRIAEALKGNKNSQYVTQEGRERQRQAVTGNTYAKGHTRIHSQEENVQIRAALVRKYGFRIGRHKLAKFVKASKQGNPKELTPKQMIQAVDVMALLLNPVNN